MLEPIAELPDRRARNGDPIATLFLLELRVNYGEIEWVADLVNVGLAGGEERNWWDVGSWATSSCYR